MSLFPDATALGAFAMVAVAASSAAQLGRGLYLPLISGYILAGALAGPYVLGLLTHEQVHSLKLLINSDAMGFIGFSAGTKFLLTELRGSLKPLMLLLVSLIAASYVIMGTGFWLATPFLHLTADYNPRKRLAVSLIVACLSIARSPSSAIAVINELSAHGGFTSATLSITVLMDIVVVLAFAGTTLGVSSLVSDLPDHAPTADPAVSRVLALFACQIATSVVAGTILGYMIHFGLALSSAAASSISAAIELARPPPAARRPRRPSSRWPNDPDMRPVGSTPMRVAAPLGLWVGARLGVSLLESVLIQLTGFGVFDLADWQLRRFGGSLDEPLIVALVAGFVVSNFTTSRLVLNRILHDSSEPVYIAFFTLTGATLQLDVLLPDLPAATFVFSLRLLGIAAGSRLGGHLSHAEPAHRDRYWMALVTQAGVTLGLLSQLTRLFPWAADLATVVTASVVMNQLAGPLLYKSAIISVGEAHPSYSPADGSRLGVPAVTRPQPRSAVLVSDDADPTARALRHRLQTRGWRVVPCHGVSSAAPDTEVPDAADVEHSVHKGMIAGGPGLERERRFGQVLRVARQRRGTTPKPILRRGKSNLGHMKQPLLVMSRFSAPVDDISLGEWELRLLWAISSLDSLDVLALLHNDDHSNLTALRHMIHSASLLPHLLEWQTSPPQILVRLCDPSREADYVQACTPPFRLTLVSPTAALPNLLAEMLHPDAHWSLVVNNALPPPPPPPMDTADRHPAQVGRSRTGLEPAGAVSRGQ